MKNILDNLGNYPKNIKDAIKNKEILITSEKEGLNFIQGGKNHQKISLLISNDTTHAGIITVSGGKHSDIEKHEGDEVFWVLKGGIQVKAWKDGDGQTTVFQKCYSLNKDEKFLIPKGYKHQYFNLESKTAKILYTISPKL